MKAGARCECRNKECSIAQHGVYGALPEHFTIACQWAHGPGRQCGAGADRIVEVLPASLPDRRPDDTTVKAIIEAATVQMCTPCAEYAERAK